MRSRIYSIIDVAVSGLFGLACAYPIGATFGAVAGTAMALAGFAIAFRSVCKFGIDRTLAIDVPQFPDVASGNFGNVEWVDAEAEEPLDLVDVLDAVGPHSRVVQMFGGSPQPTAGDLVVRIDQHLSARNRSSVRDDSGAMHEALDDLRRSLG